MASNGFFEFLGDLKGLYDEASRRRNWAQQYNPYNGGSSWWRGLGAINQMMDRNAEDRALKAQRQEYKASTDNTPPTTGIGADANGVQVMPKQKRFDFADSDYIPSAGNGYHLGDYPQTEMYGDPTDYQRQMASNAIGYDLGSFEPRQQKWFTPSSGGNGFSSIFNGNSFKGGSLVNPPTPSVSSGDSLAQGTEGQSNASARDLSRYLSNDYNIANWMQADEGRGVSNPYISALRYASKIAPLVQAAREDDMRNAFMTYNSESATPKQRADAIAKLAYYTKTPDLADRIQRGYDNDMYKQGYVRDNSDVGRNILSAFKDYEEGEQWMSPDGTGDSRTQCSNFVSDVLRKVGLNIGSPNGDELMKQFGKAYHTGLDGIQAGDVLNFKNHVGFYVGNGQYIARNSSGGVHQGSMEEAIKAFGQPLGYASVREYAAGKPRYKKDTSKESLLRQKHQYDMEKIAAQNAYKQGRSVRGNANNATILSDRAVEEANAAFSAYNEYMNKEDIDDNIKSQAREKTVQRLYGLYKALTDEDNGGMSPQKARSELRKLGESQKLAPHQITSILDDVERYGKNSETENGKSEKSGKTVGEEAADARLNGKKGKSLLETLDTFYDPDLEPTGSGYNISGQSLDDQLGDSLRAINNQRQLVEDTIKNGGYVDMFGNPISKEELARQTREIRERAGY